MTLFLTSTQKIVLRLAWRAIFGSGSEQASAAAALLDVFFAWFSGYYIVDVYSDPSDIGPAVQDACNSCFDAGGGTVFIPSRDGGLQWGWSTPVSIELLDDKTFCLRGVPGATAIHIPNGLSTSVFEVKNSRSLISIEDLIFTGAAGDLTNAPNIIAVRQARLATMRGVQMYGIRCSGDGIGCAFIIADSIHVSDCQFMACDYVGTENAGGILCLTGERDACIVESCRFATNSTDSVFRGTTYTKWDSSHYGAAQIWFGGQGNDGDVTAFGGVYVNNCYFESPSASHIVFYPESTYIIRHAKVAGCSMNSGNNRPSMYARKVQTLNVEHTNVGGSIADAVALKVESCDDLLVNRMRSSTGAKKVQFNGTMGYVEKLESADFSFDTQGGLYVPSHGIVQANGTRTAVYP